MVDVFKSPAKSTIPKSDPQIVRVDFTEADIGGRKSHMPNEAKSDKMNITHVPNVGKGS